MLSDNYTPEKYLGNGTTVAFSFGWAIIAEANIRVYLEETTTLVQTAQVLGTDFSIDSGWDSDGGTITFDTAPSSSYNVIISRDISETQEVNYKTSAGFKGQILENSFDKITGMVQDAVEIASRCLKYPVGTVDSISREMVAPGSTAGYPYWDGSAYDFITAITATGDYPGTITRGTDVSKSATPAAGDIHVATDTSKLYICFTAGTWTDYNQEIIDKNVLQIQEISQADFSGATYPSFVNVNHKFAQSITPNRDLFLSSVGVYFKTIGAGATARHLKIRVETDDAGKPSGTLATDFSAVDVDILTATALDWFNCELGQIGKLEAGTKYWIVFQRVDELGSVQFTLGASAADNPIPDEEMQRNTGAGWALYLEDQDFSIKLKSGDFTWAVGQTISVIENEYERSKADTEANSKGFIGIVKSITTVSYYSLIDIVLSGIVIAQTGLTSGALYYLDPATAGSYTATKPTTVGNFVKPVMIALSETIGLVINQVGEEVVASTTDIVFTANEAVSYENEVVYNQ